MENIKELTELARAGEMVAIDPEEFERQFAQGAASVELKYVCEKGNVKTRKVTKEQWQDHLALAREVRKFLDNMELLIREGQPIDEDLLKLLKTYRHKALEESCESVAVGVPE